MSYTARGAAAKYKKKIKNSGLAINGLLSFLALGAVYIVRNRAALINLDLWASAKQWLSRGFITNAQTNLQMKDCP